MQLTYHTDFSLRLLLYLMARSDGEVVSVGAIASAYGVSSNHLSKVAAELTRLGWLESIRGRGGGLKLLDAARGLSVGDVVRATEHNMALVECMGSANTCPITPVCRLKGVLVEARDAFLEVLDSYPLEDMVQDQGELRRLLSIPPDDGDDGRCT